MEKCKDCSVEAVMTWIDIGVFCDVCFHKEYLKRYPEALDEHLQLVSKRRKMKALVAKASEPVGWKP